MLLMYNIFQEYEQYPSHASISSSLESFPDRKTAIARTRMRPMCDVQVRLGPPQHCQLGIRAPSIMMTPTRSLLILSQGVRPPRSRTLHGLATRCRSTARCAVSVSLPVSMSTLCNLLFTDGGHGSDTHNTVRMLHCGRTAGAISTKLWDATSAADRVEVSLALSGGHSSHAQQLCLLVEQGLARIWLCALDVCPSSSHRELLHFSPSQQ